MSSMEIFLCGTIVVLTIIVSGLVAFIGKLVKFQGDLVSTIERMTEESSGQRSP